VNFVNFILKKAVGMLRVAGTEVNAQIARKEDRVKRSFDSFRELIYCD